MADVTYYSLHIRWQQKDLFGIWCTGAGDRFFSKDGKVDLQGERAALLRYAEAHAIQLEPEEPIPHDLDQVAAWLKQPSAPDAKAEALEALLNAWNMLNDLNVAIGTPNSFAALEPTTQDLYDKLFSAHMTAQPDDWLTQRLGLDEPEWSPDEIQSLVEVMTEGLRFFRDVIGA
ncbi:MAG: hypothetical protein ACI9TH_000118 [Kiritimatiellia bacterium]